MFEKQLLLRKTFRKKLYLFISYFDNCIFGMIELLLMAHLKIGII